MVLSCSSDAGWPSAAIPHQPWSGQHWAVLCMGTPSSPPAREGSELLLKCSMSGFKAPMLGAEENFLPGKWILGELSTKQRHKSCGFSLSCLHNSRCPRSPAVGSPSPPCLPLLATAVLCILPCTLWHTLSSLCQSQRSPSTSLSADRPPRPNRQVGNK